MKTLKETSPALAVLSDDVVYYASTIPENLGGMRFRYQGHDYSLYNRDETEYELIHWLSGEDTLVNGIWQDRLADTTPDAGGPLNFTNYGCTWNEEHTGYYSTDGNSRFFKVINSEFNFGADWYMEVVANVSEPLGTSCFFIDLASLGNFRYGTALAVYKFSNSVEYSLGRISTNTKAGGLSAAARTDAGVYEWGETALFTAGINRYSINQSRAFITWDGNRYYGDEFNTVQWNQWSSSLFYLFRGHMPEWENSVFRCGPTTIYDIKIWRKK